jgi:DNA topoisomerase VI subunit B
MSAPSLARVVFKTSRLAEFCSENELVNQTGHAVEGWPLVVLKELADNALDGTEEAGAGVVIDVDVSDDRIAVTDNGPGIAPETIADILDFTSRTSSREAYVSPTRGAQGNALKTLLAMPFALDGGRGETTIESQGVAHRITFSIDPIRQEPRLVRVCEGSLVKSGTRIAVSWPDSARSILDDARDRFLRIAEDYTWVNPHLTLTVKWDRDGCDPVQCAIPATDPTWHKWRPSDPTSPHWYLAPLV